MFFIPSLSLAILPSLFVIIFFSGNFVAEKLKLSKWFVSSFSISYRSEDFLTAEVPNHQQANLGRAYQQENYISDKF